MAKLKINEHFNPNSDLVLYNGDCLELLKEIPNETVKLVVTSPPYNIGKEYEKKLSINDYLESQKKVIDESIRITKSTGSICWQVGNYVDNGEIIPLDILLYPIFTSYKLKLRNRIVWHFGHGLHASKRFSGRYEVILWFTKNDDYTFNLDSVRIPQKYPQKKYFKGPKAGQFSCNPIGKNPGDIWDIPNVKSNHIEKTQHPAQFPVELIERLVLSLTNEDDWTFDPFMGVGTTQIASIIHKRKSIGSETVKDYYETALERIKLAESGKLLVRPMERPVFNPDSKEYIPPKVVKLNSEPSLFRNQED
ncbi:MAG: DNA methyltransferase [Spirochaetes bacterium RBG_16_49_21]|nr:MAG: DNA methyltransferase [Spirochaetes bacterium RBG_16_49_21]